MRGGARWTNTTRGRSHVWPRDSFPDLHLCLFLPLLAPILFLLSRSSSSVLFSLFYPLFTPFLLSFYSFFLFLFYICSSLLSYFPSPPHPFLLPILLFFSFFSFPSSVLFPSSNLIISHFLVLLFPFVPLILLSSLFPITLPSSSSLFVSLPHPFIPSLPLVSLPRPNFLLSPTSLHFHVPLSPLFASPSYYHLLSSPLSSLFPSFPLPHIPPSYLSFPLSLIPGL